MVRTVRTILAVAYTLLVSASRGQIADSAEFRQSPAFMSVLLTKTVSEKFQSLKFLDKLTSGSGYVLHFRHTSVLGRNMQYDTLSAQLSDTFTGCSIIFTLKGPTGSFPVRSLVSALQNELNSGKYPSYIIGEHVPADSISQAIHDGRPEGSAVLRPHYFSLAFEIETGTAIPLGFSMDYSFRTSLKSNYFFGVGLTVTGSVEKKPVNVYYQGYRTRNGTVTSDIAGVSFVIHQLFLIRSSHMAIPHVYIDVGGRFFQNSVETSFSYNFTSRGILGGTMNWGYLPNIQDIYSNKDESLFLGMGAGCSFTTNSRVRPFAELGFKFMGSSTYVDVASVYYSQGVHYTTGHTKSFFATISIGLML